MRTDFRTLTLPTLVTLSPTDLKAEPEYSLACKLDWRKVPRFLEGSWPEPWPLAHFLGGMRRNDIAWFKAALQADYCVFDVETERLNDGTYSGKIIQVGLYPKGGTPCIWDRMVNSDFRFPDLFKSLIGSLPMVAHNTPFDVARIYDNFQVSVWEYAELHDTILMHHLLWPEFPHGLEFIASVVSLYSKAKHLGVGNYDYLVGDIVDTALAFDASLNEFKQDKASSALYWNEYRPLLPIIIEFMRTGIPVNADFVEYCLSYLPQQKQAAQDIADVYCGYPDVSIESGSQMRVLLDILEDIFGAAKKLGTTVTKKLSKKTGDLSFDKDTISALRSCWDLLDPNEDIDTEIVEKRIANGAHPLLEAKALWGRSRVMLGNYIKPLLIPLESTEEGYSYKGSLHVGDGAAQVSFKEVE